MHQRLVAWAHTHSCCLPTLPGGVLSCLFLCPLAPQAPLTSPSLSASSNGCHSPPSGGLSTARACVGHVYLTAFQGPQTGSTRLCLMGDSLGVSLLPIPGNLEYPRAEIAIPLGLPIRGSRSNGPEGRGDAQLNFLAPGSA